MSCIPCGASQYAISTSSSSSSPRLLTEIIEDCPYDLTQLQHWQQLLLCAKRTGTFDEATMNRALGITLSAINHSYNICYFQKNLDEFQPLIFQIINDNLCP